MARFLIFATLILCVLYLNQVNAMPQEKPQESDLENWLNKAKDAFERTEAHIKEQVEELKNNPTVQDAIKGAEQFFQEAGQNIKNTAEKLKKEFQ